ncbi:hypothetical protein H7347_06845 [Corynebacterium sp. zg-331]|uniref:hypothetical protein n=1 Tax=unclassified Corynebacterium TaxID=2624378 RepID=UPI00128C7D70|nr:MULTISPECIES: hypothetical protein [unclassified Corynebacterium]MBC3186289.1 hypothetical protein [Corynebacterium sp. zg-331]MPV52778.1 hypothetical protein [Corynebacterium sp. zg331]
MITPIELVQRGLRRVTTAPVVSKVPNPRPPLFVRVDSSTSRALSPVHAQALVIIQVYGLDLEEVLTTVSACRQYLTDRIDADDPLVFGWGEHTLVEFPDPDIPDTRWQLTGQLIYTLT